MKTWEIWLACILFGVLVTGTLYCLSSIFPRPDNFLAGALLPFTILYFKELFYHDR